MQPPPVRRYHSLDALRAAMMLLGLVLHSAASYTRTPLGPAWPYNDPRTSVAFDILILFIHLFRMPVFFVVAGFFGALLYSRDGIRGFARNRAMRVLLPLVMFWVVVPLVGLGFIFSTRQIGGDLPWADVTRRSVMRQPVLGHLWFLYYLIIFYAAAIIVTPLVSHVRGPVRQRAAAIARALAAGAWGPFALALLTTVTLLPMHGPALDTAPSLLPPIRVLAAYGVFFGFGWMLFAQRDLISSFGARWASTFGAGVAATVGYVIVVAARPAFDDFMTWHLTGIAFAGMAMWLSIFGIVGMFVRHVDQARPIVRYVSDASYWMYLTHAAPCAWLPGVFAHLGAPAFVKFALVLGLTTLLTAGSYFLFVRSTVVGELLNGRRYPRSLPMVRVDNTMPA